MFFSVPSCSIHEKAVDYNAIGGHFYMLKFDWELVFKDFKKES